MASKLKKNLRLPSLPTVAVQLLQVFNDPDAPIQKITEIIQADPAITTKLLKAANSARYGMKGDVTDVRRAVAMLGKNNVTPLVLSFSLARDSDSQSGELRKFWLRSFAMATAAEALGTHQNAAFASECFTVNLLAGIGQLALMKAEPERYAQCLMSARLENRPLSEIEDDEFGVHHIELSAQMLEEIGFPGRCVEAVRELQHKTDQAPSEDPLAVTTSAANAVARLLCDDEPGLALISLEECLARIKYTNGLNPESVIAEVRKRLQANASIFNIDPNELPESADLLNDALEQLSEFMSMVAVPETQNRVPAELVAENGRLKERVADLVRETNLDALTGVYNRAYLNGKLEETHAVSRIRKQQYAVAVIDIDHFKKVNDTYGHQAGDHVLVQVAQALNGMIRGAETFARFGGEEFAVIMENTSSEGMSVVGERLRSTVEALDVKFQGTSIPVTVSVGIANGFPADDDEFPKRLFGVADAALYESKRNGRNRVTIDSSLTADASADASPQSDTCPIG